MNYKSEGSTVEVSSQIPPHLKPSFTVHTEGQASTNLSMIFYLKSPQDLLGSWLDSEVFFQCHL